MSRRGPIIAGVIAGVLAILLIVFLVLPKMGDVSAAKADLSEAEDQEQQLQLQLQQLEAAKADAPQTTEEIRKIDEQIPPTVDLEGMLLLLSDAATQAGVDFFTVAPGTPTPSVDGTYSIIPTAITVTGSYFACEEYLYNLEHLQRATKVLSLSLSPGGGSAEAGTDGTTTTDTGTTGETGATSAGTVPGELSMQLSAELYTTDVSAGPGSTPDSPAATPSPGVAATSPAPTTSPGA